jgi:hypothetical protein
MEALDGFSLAWLQRFVRYGEFKGHIQSSGIQPVGIINVLLGMRPTSYTFHLDSKEEWDPLFQIAVLSNCVTT